jgi:hypothetical protein
MWLPLGLQHKDHVLDVHQVGTYLRRTLAPLILARLKFLHGWDQHDPAIRRLPEVLKLAEQLAMEPL